MLRKRSLITLKAREPATDFVLTAAAFPANAEDEELSVINRLMLARSNPFALRACIEVPSQARSLQHVPPLASGDQAGLELEAETGRSSRKNLVRSVRPLSDL
jgi:hypothetical protein